MTVEDIKEVYVTWANFYRKCRVAYNAHGRWLKKGYIPFKTQLLIEYDSKGKLKADIDQAEPHLRGRDDN